MVDQFPTPFSHSNLRNSIYRRGILLSSVSYHRAKGQQASQAPRALCHCTAKHWLPIASESLACQTFKLQLQRYQELTSQRKRVEQQAESILSEHKDYLTLKTIPEIGPIIALTILAEGAHLRRFGHHRQFLKYCGLDFAKNQSANFRGQEKLSKRGNARLRLALFLATISAVRQTENCFRDKFHRYTKAVPNNADCKRKARTAVMAKMARVIHALVKSSTPCQGYFEVSPSGSIPISRAVGANRTP